MDYHDNFTHILKNTFLLLGFIVIGIFLNITASGKYPVHGASQGSGVIGIFGVTGGNYAIPVTMTGIDAGTGAVVSVQTLNLNVAVSNPLTCQYFTASPSIIFPPQPSTLSWYCPGATVCSIDNGVGPVAAPIGSTNVTPSSTTMYTLTCNNGVLQAQVTTQVKTSFPALKEVLP